MGFLISDDKGFIVTQKSKDLLENIKIEEIKSNFTFSNFDKKIINKIGTGILNLDEEKESLIQRYKNNEKESNRQLIMLTGRCEKLAVMGILEKTDAGFRVTDKAWEMIKGNDEVKVKVDPSFKFGAYDINNVFKHFNKAHELTAESLKDMINKAYSDPSIAEKQYTMVYGRLLKNVGAGYVLYDETRKVFTIAQKGLEELNKVKVKTDEVLNLDKVREMARKYSLSEKQFDTHILRLHGSDSDFQGKSRFNENFDIKKGIDSTLKDSKATVNKNTANRRGYIVERQFKENIGVDPKGKPLNVLRVIIDEKGNVITAFPSRSMIDNADSKYSLRKYNLTKFDFEFIAGASVGGVWSKEYLWEKYYDLEVEELQRRTDSILKRMETLQKAGLVEKISDTEFKLDQIFLERDRNWREKKLDKFSTEQKAIFNDLKQFLNLTDVQISHFIYNSNTILANADIKQLVNQEYLGEASRDLKGDGTFTKVYYLTTKGKKAASHIEGVEVEKIYDSKLHNRPEELRHDVLVYSAYKQYEKLLETEGCKVTKIMTDKQLRAEFNRTNGIKPKDDSAKVNLIRQEKIELPDLYLEFEEIRTGEKGFINLEVDCDYKPHVIRSKAEGIDNLVWFTDTEKQADTIKRTLENKAIVFNLSF